MLQIRPSTVKYIKKKKLFNKFKKRAIGHGLSLVGAVNVGTWGQRVVLREAGCNLEGWVPLTSEAPFTEVPCPGA